MRLLSTLACLVMLIACEDSKSQADSAMVDQGQVDSQVLDSRSDAPTSDLKQPDQSTMDLPTADKTTPDLPKPSPDIAVADLPIAPPDLNFVDFPAADVALGPLKVLIIQLKVWADLMPIVPPDPTHVELTLSLVNQSSGNVTGIKVNEALLFPSGGSSTPQQLTMQAQGGFNGVVAAGQTVQVVYKKVSNTIVTPLPTTCGGQVTLRLIMGHDGGTVGPIFSMPAIFGCTYLFVPARTG